MNTDTALLRSALDAAHDEAWSPTGSAVHIKTDPEVTVMMYTEAISDGPPRPEPHGGGIPIEDVDRFDAAVLAERLISR